jgi:hypothetical protein
MGDLIQFRGKDGRLIGHPTSGFGFIKDPGVHGRNGIYNLFHVHPASKIEASALPDMCSLLPFAPPVWNQDQTGSCCGHGFAGAETTTFAAHGKPLPSPVLPRVRYNLGRAIDRSNPSLPLIDEGAQPSSLVRAAMTYGVVLEGEDDGGRTALSPDYAAYLVAHVNDELKLGELEKAGKRLLLGYNAITDYDPQKTLKIRQSLVGKCAVTVAVDAGSDAYQGYDESKGPLDFTGSEPDHENFLLGYGTPAALAAAKLIPDAWVKWPTPYLYLLQNSWGMGLWTESGRAWVTEKFVQQGACSTLVCNLGL